MGDHHLALGVEPKRGNSRKPNSPLSSWSTSPLCQFSVTVCDRPAARQRTRRDLARVVKQRFGGSQGPSYRLWTHASRLHKQATSARTQPTQVTVRLSPLAIKEKVLKQANTHKPTEEQLLPQSCSHYQPPPNTHTPLQLQPGREELTPPIHTH